MYIVSKKAFRFFNPNREDVDAQWGVNADKLFFTTEPGKLGGYGEPQLAPEWIAAPSDHVPGVSGGTHNNKATFDAAVASGDIMVIVRPQQVTCAEASADAPPEQPGPDVAKPKKAKA